MRFCVLGSGSKGNATYVEALGTAVLIDNGFSGKEVEKRLARIGVEPGLLSAILLTHEHRDHAQGVGIVARKHDLPLYANPATLHAAAPQLGRLPRVREFSTGVAFPLGSLRVHPFAVSHDTVDPVGFVIHAGTRSLGYCTDTGMLSTMIRHRLRNCNGLIIECNHDPRMLQEGPYPLPLKQRVHSRQGHLANSDAAACIAELLHAELRHVVLAHISETNNEHDLVLNVVRQVLHDAPPPHPAISLAWQDRVGELVDLGEGR